MHLPGTLEMTAIRLPLSSWPPAPAGSNDTRTYVDAGFQGVANWK